MCYTERGATFWKIPLRNGEQKGAGGFACWTVVRWLALAAPPQREKKKGRKLRVCSSRQGKPVWKRGKTDRGQRRRRWPHPRGCHQPFLLEAPDEGWLPESIRPGRTQSKLP